MATSASVLIAAALGAVHDDPPSTTFNVSTIPAAHAPNNPRVIPFAPWWPRILLKNHHWDHETHQPDHHPDHLRVFSRAPSL